jgi:hypothetical protein
LKPVEKSAYMIAERLFYHEPANFVLCDLLMSGCLQEVVGEAKSAADGALGIMHVLATIFNRQPVPSGTLARGYQESYGHKGSFVLAPVDTKIAQYFSNWNDKTMHLYRLILKHEKIDLSLPLTRVRLFSWEPQKDSASCPLATSYLVRSPFHAIVGLNDDFQTMQDMIETSNPRNHFTLPTFHLSSKVNSYALDFYKHGHYKSLIKLNFIRDGDIYNLLKDWMLLVKVLKSCVGEEDLRFSEAVTHLADTWDANFKISGFY